jgi:hypothetical protein
MVPSRLSEKQCRSHGPVLFYSAWKKATLLLTSQGGKKKAMKEKKKARSPFGFNEVRFRKILCNNVIVRPGAHNNVKA